MSRIKVKPKARNGGKTSYGLVRSSSSHDAFVEKVRAMSSRERVQFMVAAGINTEDGKLTENYRD